MRLASHLAKEQQTQSAVLTLSWIKEWLWNRRLSVLFLFFIFFNSYPASQSGTVLSDWEKKKSLFTCHSPAQLQPPTAIVTPRTTQTPPPPPAHQDCAWLHRLVRSLTSGLTVVAASPGLCWLIEKLSRGLVAPSGMTGGKNKRHSAVRCHHGCFCLPEYFSCKQWITSAQLGIKLRLVNSEGTFCFPVSAIVLCWCFVALNRPFSFTGAI